MWWKATGDMVVEAVEKALGEGDSAETILKQGMMAAMGEVGRLFEEGEYFVPELLVAARAMQGGMDILRPLLVAEDVEPVGKIVIGTVKGDLHDIGKNLVSMMLQGAGFEVTDPGLGRRPGEICGCGQDQRRIPGGHVGTADDHHGQYANDD